MSSADDASETKEQEVAAAAVSVASAGTAEGASRKSPSTGQPADETKLEAPSRRTLLMLGAISLTTLIMWGAGRAACNYDVPGDTPRLVGMDEKTQHPKGVALEFALAVAGGRFADAEKLSTGEALAAVQREVASCGACSERKASAAELLVVPVVTKANPVAGFVKVTLSGPRSSTQVLLVEKVTNAWKVTRTFELDAALPPLPEPPAPMGQGPLLP